MLRIAEEKQAIEDSLLNPVTSAGVSGGPFINEGFPGGKSGDQNADYIDWSAGVKTRRPKLHGQNHETDKGPETGGVEEHRIIEFQDYPAIEEQPLLVEEVGPEQFTPHEPKEIVVEEILLDPIRGEEIIIAEVLEEESASPSGVVKVEERFVIPEPQEIPMIHEEHQQLDIFGENVMLVQNYNKFLF